MENYFRYIPLSTLALTREIKEINKISYVEVFGRNSEGDYNVYFANKLYKVKNKGNTITVLLYKRGNKLVSDDFIRSFTRNLIGVLQGVLSRDRNSYSPFDYQVLNENSFIVNSTIKIEVKRYFDPYAKERTQVGRLADFLGKLNNDNTGTEIVFRILGDTYKIDTNIIKTPDEMVDYLKNAERADIRINVNLGRNRPVKISLKWSKYRQLSGVNEFRGINQIDEFIEKVSLRQKLSQPYQGLYEPIIDPSYRFTEQVVFSDDVDYLMIGDIKMNGNQLSADQVYTRKTFRKKLYIVSSRDARPNYGIPNVRIGIYDFKYLNANEDMSGITVESLRDEYERSKNKK